MHLHVFRTFEREWGVSKDSGLAEHFDAIFVVTLKSSVVYVL